MTGRLAPRPRRRPPKPSETLRPHVRLPPVSSPRHQPFTVPNSLLPPPSPRKHPAISPPKRAPTPTSWTEHRASLKERFPEGWNPPRKISREAMNALRLFHQQDPEQFSVPMLAAKFLISPEAVRRILRSRWQPTGEREVQFRKREMMDEQQEELDRAKRKEEALKREVMKRAITAAGYAVRALGGTVVPSQQEKDADEEGEDEDEEGEGELVLLPAKSKRKGKYRETLDDRLLASRLRAAQEAAHTAQAVISSPKRGGAKIPPASSGPQKAGIVYSYCPPSLQHLSSRISSIPDLSAPLSSYLSSPDTNPGLQQAYEKRMEQRFPDLGVEGVRDFRAERERKRIGRARGNGWDERARTGVDLVPVREEEGGAEEGEGGHTGLRRGKGSDVPNRTLTTGQRLGGSIWAPRRPLEDRNTPRRELRPESAAESTAAGATRARAAIERRLERRMEQDSFRLEQERKAEKVLESRMSALRGTLPRQEP